MPLLALRIYVDLCRPLSQPKLIVGHLAKIYTIVQTPTLQKFFGPILFVVPVLFALRFDLSPHFGCLIRLVIFFLAHMRYFFSLSGAIFCDKATICLHHANTDSEEDITVGSDMISSSAQMADTCFKLKPLIIVRPAN